MLFAMRKIVLLLTCLAGKIHGSRIQASRHMASVSFPTQRLLCSRRARGERMEALTGALSALGLGLAPAAAFHPAGFPATHPFSSSRAARFARGHDVSKASPRLQSVSLSAAGRDSTASESPNAPQMASPSSGGLRLLEWIPSQKLLVGFARFFWTTLWRVMLSELAPQSPEGAYVRPAPQIGSDAHWPDSLPMVAGRYHVYVGNACPWCHRVTSTLALRGLRDAISVSNLADDPERASRGGWCFDDSDPDPLVGASDLKAVYDACTPGDEKYTGRCTAPLLVDLQTCSIISNESGDIIRMLNEFDTLDDTSPAQDGRVVDLYPPELRNEIDETNAWVYETINNGVYRAGFATKQEAYEEAERAVHTSLERVDSLLSKRRFLVGETVTEADVRLLPTAMRFDGVYASFFRCGRKQIRSDYPNLRRWMQDMLRLTGPGLFDLNKARMSYYRNLFPLNPGGIVPAGPTPEDLGMLGGSSKAPESWFTWRTPLTGSNLDDTKEPELTERHE